MNYERLLIIYKVKLPKDILNIVKNYLFHNRNEKYYRDKHITHTQKYVNYLILNSDLTYNIYVSYKFTYYHFGYDINRDDYIKNNRNNGHSRYNNGYIRIRSCFCTECGNYVDNNNLKNKLIICNCQ
jgi:hypothetical protein